MAQKWATKWLSEPLYFYSWKVAHLWATIQSHQIFKHIFCIFSFLIKLENNKLGIDNAGFNTVNEIYTDEVSFNEWLHYDIQK